MWQGVIPTETLKSRQRHAEPVAEAGTMVGTSVATDTDLLASSVVDAARHTDVGRHVSMGEDGAWRKGRHATASVSHAVSLLLNQRIQLCKIIIWSVTFRNHLCEIIIWSAFCNLLEPSSSRTVAWSRQGSSFGKAWRLAILLVSDSTVLVQERLWISKWRYINVQLQLQLPPFRMQPRPSAVRL